MIENSNKKLNNAIMQILEGGKKNSVLIRVHPEFKKWLQGKTCELEEKTDNHISITKASQILVKEIKIMEQDKKKKKFDFSLF